MLVYFCVKFVYTPMKPVHGLCCSRHRVMMELSSRGRAAMSVGYLQASLVLHVTNCKLPMRTHNQSLGCANMQHDIHLGAQPSPKAAELILVASEGKT